MDDKVKILAKRIADERPVPYQIAIWIDELIKSSPGYMEYRVVIHPFDAPVPIDEGLRKINENLEWKLARIEEASLCEDCVCCERVRQILEPIAFG